MEDRKTKITKINENLYIDSFYLSDDLKYSMSGSTLRYILNLLPDANKVPYAEIGEHRTNKICEIEEVYVVEVNDYDSHPICFVGSTKELCENFINEYDGVHEKEDLIISVQKLNLG